MGRRKHRTAAIHRFGKPTQSANIESLNARIRVEFLNEHAFLTLADARLEASLWQSHYNEV